MIRTVLGDITSEQLGVTLSHEHLLMTGGWPIRQEPDFRLDSVEVAVEEIEPFKKAGGCALVEMTPLGFGRSARGLSEIARLSGAHVVACTGFHKMGYYADNHWVHRYTTEQISQLLVDEITLGMDEHGLEGPLPDTTDIRAGVVKFSTEYHRAGPTVEKLAEAIGEVHRRTGAPISTHTEKGTMGHCQLDLLGKAGVPADAVILGHIDHNPDPGLLLELADRGAYLICDMPGRIKYAPDSQTLNLLTALVEAGHTDRILFGSDLARRSYWTNYGGGPGLSYLLTTFLPRLHAAGLDDLATRALVTNPARAFSLRRVA